MSRIKLIFDYDQSSIYGKLNELLTNPAYTEYKDYDYTVRALREMCGYKSNIAFPPISGWMRDYRPLVDLSNKTMNVDVYEVALNCIKDAMEECSSAHNILINTFGAGNVYVPMLEVKDMLFYLLNEMKNNNFSTKLPTGNGTISVYVCNIFNKLNFNLKQIYDYIYTEGLKEEFKVKIITELESNIWLMVVSAMSKNKYNI